MKLRPENLFVDELDGRWTLGLTDENGGTESIGHFEKDDAWLYPHELGFDYVINVFLCKDDLKTWHFNVYDLPKNWSEIVTQDSGMDGKPSVHDIMVEVY